MYRVIKASHKLKARINLWSTLPMHKLTLALAALLSIPAYAATPTAPAPPQVQADYGKLPLSFEANHGQTDPQVKFTSRGQGYSLYLTNSAAILTLSKGKPALKLAQGEAASKAATGERAFKGHNFSRRAKSDSTKGTGFSPYISPSQTSGVLTPEATPPDILRMSLANANPNAQVEGRITGEDPLPGKVNYFIGNDPTKWHADIPTYAKVRYSQVYKGIDLVYYGNQRQLEYDFVVAPHANSNRLALQIGQFPPKVIRKT